MPSPKSGKAGKAVAPTGSTQPEEADQADPGKMAKIKAQQQASSKGKYGAVKPKPFKPTADNQSTAGEEAGAASQAAAQSKAVQGTGEAQQKQTKEQEKTWIEIELVGEDDEPIPGEKYRITLPNGTADEGTLDETGCARVDGIEPGTCQITFPDLDKDAWEPL